MYSDHPFSLEGCVGLDLCCQAAGRLLRLSSQHTQNSLGWAEDVFQELLNLVDVRLDLAVEGDEGRVRARGQILEVCRLPGEDITQPLGTSDRAWMFFAVNVIYTKGTYWVVFLTA